MLLAAAAEASRELLKAAEKEGAKKFCPGTVAQYLVRDYEYEYCMIKKVRP